MKEIDILFEPSRWKQREIDSGWISIYILGISFTLTHIIIYILFGIGTGIAVSTAAAGTLYYVLNTRSVAPLIFSVLLLPMSVLVFSYHAITGIGVFFVIILLSACYYYRSTSVLLILAICGFLIGVLLTTIFQTPLVGTDEMNFFNLASITSISDYLFSRIEHVFEFIQGGSRPGVYETFPVLYAPLFDAFNISSPRFILIVNATFWIGTAIIFRELLISYSNELPRNISPNIAAAILLASPTAIYWSSTFAKDIISASLCMFATYLFFRKRYILFIIIIGLATGIRVYSVAIISVYIATIMWSPFLVGLGLCISILFVLVYTGQIVPLFNSIMIWGYFFISPNPLNIENWIDLRMLPRLFEGLLYGIGLSVSGMYALANEKLRIQYLILGGAILIYALVIVAVGYRQTVFVQGLHYGFGTAGGNIFRRMVPMLPLIAIWMSITIKKSRIPRIEFEF